jgi:Flp pilus assembly protein TadD
MSVYVCRGLAHSRQQEYGEAAADFQKAAELQADSALPHRLLGLLFASRTGVNFADRALEHANKSCQLAEAGDWAVLDSLAAAQAAAGQFEQAAETIQKAADLAIAEKRQQCLDRKQLYLQREKLQPSWK